VYPNIFPHDPSGETAPRAENVEEASVEDTTEVGDGVELENGVILAVARELKEALHIPKAL
jgi:hypothetical protein